MRCALLARRGSFATALLATATMAAPAAAQRDGMTYRAPPSCPQDDRFFDEVAGRTGRGAHPASDAAGQSFSVVVTPEGNGFRGVLTVTSAEGGAKKREILGTSCDAVVSALALMTALAIDPSALAAPAPLGGENVSTPGGSTPPPVEEKPAGGASSPAPAYPVRAVPEPAALAPGREAQPASTSVEAPRSNQWRWSIGADGEGLAGLAPELALGGAAFVDLTDEAPSLLARSFRATISGVTSDATFAGPIGARLDWFVVRVDGCPLRASVQTVSFRLCAAVQAGVLQSYGAGLTTNASELRGWLAPGALGRVSWFLPGRFFVEGGAGVAVPVTRYGFYYQQAAAPDRSVYGPSVAGATLSAGAGYRLP